MHVTITEEQLLRMEAVKHLAAELRRETITEDQLRRLEAVERDAAQLRREVAEVLALLYPRGDGPRSVGGGDGVTA